MFFHNFLGSDLSDSLPFLLLEYICGKDAEMHPFCIVKIFPQHLIYKGTLNMLYHIQCACVVVCKLYLPCNKLTSLITICSSLFVSYVYHAIY